MHRGNDAHLLPSTDAGLPLTDGRCYSAQTMAAKGVLTPARRRVLSARYVRDDASIEASDRQFCAVLDRGADDVVLNVGRNRSVERFDCPSSSLYEFERVVTVVGRTQERSIWEGVDEP